MGVKPYVELRFVCSTNRITGLHYTYRCATLSAGYVGYLYLENHLVTPQLWVRHLKQSLCWLALPLESLSFTSLASVQP